MDIQSSVEMASRLGLEGGGFRRGRLWCEWCIIVEIPSGLGGHLSVVHATAH